MGRPITDEDRALVVRCHAAGMNTPQIVRAFKDNRRPRTADAVRRIKRALGLRQRIATRARKIVGQRPAPLPGRQNRTFATAMHAAIAAGLETMPVPVVASGPLVPRLIHRPLTFSPCGSSGAACADAGDAEHENQPFLDDADLRPLAPSS